MAQVRDSRPPMLAAHLDLRVADNTRTAHVGRQRRVYSTLVSLEELNKVSADHRSDSAVDERHTSERLLS